MPCVALLFRLCLLPGLALAAQGHAAEFALTRLADGVYAAIRSEPPGLTFVSNTVFIINDDDVVVVDTGIGPSTARNAISALKTLTAKPVRYVINTHWHNDHMMGNEAYRDAWPGVEFIGHANAAAEMMSTGAANRRQLLEQGPAFAKQIREAMAKNVNLAGKQISNDERASYRADIAWAERYFVEAPRIRLIAPTLVFQEKLTLMRGSRAISVRYLGRAHTAADIVVYLPDESILITGDLVVWPIPLFGSTSFPIDYIATLEKLLAIRPAVLVPGHGPVMRDDAYVRIMLALLKSIESQTRAALGRGETVEQAQQSVNLDIHRDKFAEESVLKRSLFNSYVILPGIKRAYLQLSGKL